MDLVTKDFPVTTGDATDEYPHGTFEVILSAPTLDRDGEVVDSKAFEPLPAHITFDTDHSMTCDSVVGSGTPSYAEDGTLRVKGGYCSDERSQTIRQKVAEGHIRTTSVTFMAAKREKDAKGVQHVVEAELLNGTFTPIPSNRESVVLSAKSIVAKEGRRNSSTDAEHIQAAHDAMAALGAACGTKSHTPGETYEIDYIDDGTVTTLTVTPDADAPTEPDAALKSAVDAADPAAPAAGSAADTADDDELALKARLSVIENAARFAFDL